MALGGYNSRPTMGRNGKQVVTVDEGQPTRTSDAPSRAPLAVLVIDDERSVRAGCHETAQALGYLTYTAETAADGYAVLEAHSIEIVLLDLRLPGITDLEALHEIRSRWPEVIVVVITGYATVESAVRAMKMGAYDYIAKPFNVEELELLLERVSEHLQLTAENRLLREKLRSTHGFGGLIGCAPEMEHLYRLITKAAHTRAPVLILGESGTGKELVARAIHFSGPNHTKPFTPLDCASLMPGLIESELFGYVRGAFTGAERSHEGLLAISEGGTLFLDEVGELPSDLQAKLLRALQEKEIRPVGSTRRVSIDIRIIAATHRDLEKGVAEGTFRQDLFYRLNVLTLSVPPLRERKQDIPLLAESFLERLWRLTGFRREISDEAMTAMLAYDWPGNVRELENVIDRVCALGSGRVIQLEHLPDAMQRARAALSVGPETRRSFEVVPIAELERQAILNAIDRAGGDKVLAARLLGIAKTTLYRRLKEYFPN